jgi:DNA-binding ferritin-like protein
MKQRLVEMLSPLEHKQGLKDALKLLQGEMRPYDGKNHHYADLAVWLAFLRALGMIHHSHHWQTMGKSFYGDHLLYERFYKAIQDEVDTVGEKVIGLDSPVLTNYFLQIFHMKSFMKKVSKRKEYDRLRIR